MKSPRTLRRSLLSAAAIAAIAAIAGFVPPALATGYTWDIGNFSASGVPSTLLVADLLAIGVGNYKYFDTGFNTQGSVSWIDSLYFQNGSTISNSGLWDTTADASFGDGGYSGVFANSGVFRKSGGAGATTIAGITFNNSGTIDAQTGSIVFASGSAAFNAGTQFTGAGAVRVTNNASFNGAFGSQNLQLASGTYTGNSAQINGTVNWITGTLVGGWEVAAGQTLVLAGGNYKYFSAALANNGTIAALDTLYLQNGSTLTNAGLYDLQADIGFGDGGYGGGLVNNGVLRKSAGTGASVFSAGAGIVNNGIVDVQTGSMVFASGAATFNAGTQFTGAGAAQVTSNAAFNGAFTSQNLQLLSGSFTGSGAVINGAVSWTTGGLAGTWDIAAGQTLTLLSGNYKYVDGTVGNHGTIAALDTLYFRNGNVLTNAALYDLQADVGLGDGGYSGSFVNNGVFRKSAGAGSSSIAGVAFVNNGEINAQTGTINFSSGSARFNDGTHFSGAGQVAVTANATFVGSYTTAGDLSLYNGVFTGGDGSPGSKGVMNGNTNWVTGTLAGTWDVAAGRTLSLQPGNYKYVNGSLTNKGTIAALETLYFQNGNTLSNPGVYDLQADVGLGDGGYSGSFVNTGVFRKSSGSGSSSVSGTTFINSGEINAQSGTINFASGLARFNDGTHFSGAGQVAVTSNASFVGAYTSTGNLSLHNGVFTGGDGSPGSKGVMNGDTRWATGTLAGTWDVAAGRTLTLQGGNYKYLNGTLTNKGTIAAVESLYLQNGNTLNNQGRYDLQDDVGVGDGGYSGSFVNTGLLVKSAGSGTSSLQSVAFSNAAGGVVDVRSGVIQLPNNFSNEGTLKGAGSFATNLLNNLGHVAPGSIGEAPGLLTLNGNYAQGAAGSFDVGLENLAAFGNLWVNGSASLGGTIAVECVGSCSFTAGTELVVLHSTGLLSGSFANLTMSGFAAGAFEVAYLGNDVVLRITQGTVAAVPEPERYAMLLAGLAGLGFVARRLREAQFNARASA